jgi:anti-sigma factor RsiW
MSDCRDFEDLLPLYAGRDLDNDDSVLVERHLGICDGCRSALSEFRQVIESDIFVTPGDIGVPDLARRRIALQAADATRSSGWNAFSGRGLRSGAMAVAAAALFALVAVPFALRNGGGNAPGEEITKIDIVSTPDGQVTLAWSNGAHDSYTVYKSDNPRNFSDGEAHVVLGTVWTDTSPAPGQLVFYRVE